MSPLKVMRPGPCLLAAVISLGSPGLAHADEIMRLCGPRGVGFIRTAKGQSCLYDSTAPATPPSQSSPPASPSQPAPAASPTASGNP